MSKSEKLRPLPEHHRNGDQFIDHLGDINRQYDNIDLSSRLTSTMEQTDVIVIVKGNFVDMLMGIVSSIHFLAGEWNGKVTYGEFYTDEDKRMTNYRYEHVSNYNFRD